MEQYALYLALKNIIMEMMEGFKCSFNDMDSNASNVVGIYVKGGEPSIYRELGTGVYINSVARVQFLVQGGQTNDSLMSVLELMDKLKKAMSKAFNRIEDVSSQLTIVDGVLMRKTPDSSDDFPVEVMILSTKLLGEADFLGKSGQGLPRYSLNIKFEYNIKGGN